MNLVCLMLSKKKIPKTLCLEAANWTLYVLNRSTMVTMKNVTLVEAWSGVKPLVDHFQVFGNAWRTKLENKILGLCF